jgi:hypothetical protein
MAAPDCRAAEATYASIDAPLPPDELAARKQKSGNLKCDDCHDASDPLFGR